jgi:hypothetical protein
MRARGYISAAIMLMLQGCSMISYEGSYNDPNSGQGNQDETPIPVSMALGDASARTETPAGSSVKGNGPVDELSQLDGKDIYVYAFNKDMLTSYDTTGEDDMTNTLVDGSLDQPGAKGGRRAQKVPGTLNLMWADSESDVYYHSGNLNVLPFEFYAYYLGGLQVEEDDYIRGEDIIDIKVQIDGHNDLMSAKAEVTAEQLKALEDEDERANAIEYAFSYYTAQRNVVPTFYFKHHLARMEFELVPRYNPSGIKRVQVKSIEVQSRYKALFTVAEKSHPSQLGLTFFDDVTWFDVKEDDGSPIQEDRYDISTLASPDEVVDNIPIGGSLMVASHKCPYCSSDGVDEETGEILTECRIDPIVIYLTMCEVLLDGTKLDYVRTRLEIPENNQKPVKLKAGNKYVVKFQVYGASTITTDVSLEPWHPGGKLEVDTEYDKPNI